MCVDWDRNKYPSLQGLFWILSVADPDIICGSDREMRRARVLSFWNFEDLWHPHSSPLDPPVIIEQSLLCFVCARAGVGDLSRRERFNTAFGKFAFYVTLRYNGYAGNNILLLIFCLNILQTLPISSHIPMLDWLVYQNNSGNICIYILHLLTV